MKKKIYTMLVILFAMILASCTATMSNRRELTKPAFTIQPNEPIAIMPFETETALSNLGGHLSDEIIVNLLEHVPDMKIIPASAVRNYTLSASLNVGGIPDMHAMHKLKEGLKCRYLLTGNMYTSFGDVNYTNTYTDRIATGSVTVRLVDCDSLNVVWATRVESSFSTAVYYEAKNSDRATTYQTDGEMMQGLIRNLGYEVAKNFFDH